MMYGWSPAKLPVVYVAVIAASFAVVDGIGVPRCFVNRIIKPFGVDVDNILEHASAKGFIHRCRETRDMAITVPAVSAALADCSSVCFWRSSLIRCRNSHALLHTCPRCPCTWSYKLVHLWNPWWQRYGGLSACYPSCPNSNPSVVGSGVPVDPLNSLMHPLVRISFI